MRTEAEIAEGYAKYRGKCKAMSEAAVAADPTLRLVRGHVLVPGWGTEEAHWWCERPDGTIYDPSVLQFPFAPPAGAYTEFDGTVECAECGKTGPEAEFRHESRYSFCSTLCHGRFVGIF